MDGYENAPKYLATKVKGMISDIVSTNSNALNFLQRNEGSKAIATLDLAEMLCNKLKATWVLNTEKLGPMSKNLVASRSLIMTYNNLSVYYKQQLKEQVAIRYLKKVCTLQEQMVTSDT